MSVPPIESGPPYSRDFLAHLHGEGYEDASLFKRVCEDQDARSFLHALDRVQQRLWAYRFHC
ncbi:hypothetical protein BTZ20_2221 [Rhodococcus sp. MTM3W5.2]|nr:hypothetical protein BTZ20_2221 [Rhodococcus sp. MTM3W5.2]